MAEIRYVELEATGNFLMDDLSFQFEHGVGRAHFLFFALDDSRRIRTSPSVRMASTS